VTENLPHRKPENKVDIARIHMAVDDALSVLLHKGSREEDFDLKVEFALRAIREELQKVRNARGEKK
jgi:hypothetical protein